MSMPPTRRDNSSFGTGVPEMFMSCLKTENRDKLLKLLQMGHNPNIVLRFFDVRLLLSGAAEKMRRLEPYLERCCLLQNVTILHLAVMINDSHSINILLNFGAKINEFCGSKDNDLSVLMLAVVLDHTDLIEMLVRRGANYSLWNRDYRTPLDLAIISNSIPAVRCLAQYKRFYYNNNSQKSRLTICEYVRKFALPDRLEIVGRMVEIGYFVGHYSEGNIMTLILERMSTSHKHITKVFELLLDKDEKLLFEKRSQTGETLLHLAVKNSSLPLTKLLLEKGIAATETDNDGNSALHCLPYEKISPDGIEILKEFLKRDVDVFQKNGSGVSPFELAVKIHNPRVAAIFSEHFKNPRNGISDRSVIHEYLSGKTDKTADPHVIKSFLAFGLPIDARDEEKRTTLHCLIANHGPSNSDVLSKCISILSQAEGLLEAADSRGVTPIMLAIKRNMPLNVIMKLMPVGSIDQVTREGQDIVSLLITRFNDHENRLKLLKLLIDKGVDLNKKERFGCKALISAARKSRLQPQAEPVLLLKSGYLPQDEDIGEAIEWDLQLLDHILRYASSTVIRTQFQNILLSVVANFIPQNPPIDLMLKVVKKLTEDFHVDVNFFEKKTSVWHLLIGSAHRFPVLPIIDHLLTIPNANLNLGFDWHEVGIPLTYALILGEYKIAERLIHTMTRFDHVCIKRMKLKFGFSGLLSSLCKRNFRMPVTFFERGYGQDQEIVKELEWLRNYLSTGANSTHHHNICRVKVVASERDLVTTTTSLDVYNQRLQTVKDQPLGIVCSSSMKRPYFTTDSVPSNSPIKKTCSTEMERKQLK